MNQETKEKRRFCRISVDGQTSFATGHEPDETKRVYSQAKIRDLSAVGFSFEFGKALKPGEFLHIKLDFPKTKTHVVLQGEVQHSVAINSTDISGPRYVVGVKFLGNTYELVKLFSKCV